MKRTLGQAGGKFAGLAVVLMLAAVSFFSGTSCERLKAEKLKAAAGQNQRQVPDLRALKQLAQNSQIFSALNPDEKSAALACWHDQLNAWIGWVETQSI